MDVLGLIGGDELSRWGMRQWSVCDSRIEGCIGLSSPEYLCLSVTSPQSRTIPVLCLMGMLDAANYDPVYRAVNHNEQGMMIYDGRKPLSKRLYYRCVLAGDDFIQAGKSFKSVQLQSYFEALLTLEGPVPVGLRGGDYKTLLPICDGPPPYLCRALPDFVSAPVAARAVKVTLAIKGAYTGDDLEAETPLALQDVHPGEEVVVEGASSSSSGGAPGVEGPPAPPAPPAPPPAPTRLRWRGPPWARNGTGSGLGLGLR